MPDLVRSVHGPAWEVLTEGIHLEVGEAIYHADPCPEPSLSASGAKVLMHRSPRAFAWGHPRLRPADAPPPEAEKWNDAAVFGTVVHKLVLGRGKEVVEVDAADWKTKAAQQERADITAVGKIAILKSKLVEAKAIARQMTATPRAEFASEVVLVWRDKATDGTRIWCRAMLDMLGADGLIEDLKITTAELSHAFVARQIDGMGYDVSMAWYRRGLAALRPDLAGRIRTRLTFAERNEPFDILSRDLTEGELHEADIFCQLAIDRFAACQTAGEWPGVGDTAPPIPIAIPNWRKRAVLDAALTEELDQITNGD